MKALYVTFVAINAMLVAAMVAFFFVSLSDGTADSLGGLWLVLIALPAALLAGGVLAWRAANRGLALVLLLLPGIPAALYGFFIFLFVALGPDMR